MEIIDLVWSKIKYTSNKRQKYATKLNERNDQCITIEAVVYFSAASVAFDVRLLRPLCALRCMKVELTLKSPSYKLVCVVARLTYVLYIRVAIGWGH